MNTHVRFAEPLVLTISESAAQECRAQGFRHVRDVSSPHLLLDSEGRLLPELDYFESYVSSYLTAAKTCATRSR